MATIDIKDVAGKTVKSVELNDAVFDIEPNVHVMHTVVRAYRAGLRQGTATHQDPWRSSRRRQEAVASEGHRSCPPGFHPLPSMGWRRHRVRSHPRSYAFRVNRKEVKLAMRSALSAKLADGEITVVDQFAFEAPRTKDAKASMRGPGLRQGSCYRCYRPTTT